MALSAAKKVQMVPWVFAFKKFNGVHDIAVVSRGVVGLLIRPVQKCVVPWVSDVIRVITVVTPFALRGACYRLWECVMGQ